MGIGPAALRLYYDLAHMGVLKQGSVCEIGSQDFVPENCDVSELFQFFERPKPDVMGSGREFMAALGFGAYVCIDKDGRHGAMAYDLNTMQWHAEIPQFDLVTNHGTTEHIFDQANCFRLIHYATLPGGLMIHIVPTRGVVSHGKEVGYGAHGLYLYTRGFFEDLARDNGYQTIRLYETEDSAGALMVAALKNNGGPFKVPTQGMYL